MPRASAVPPLRLALVAATLLPCWLYGASAAAQREGPQSCDQAPETADYGPLEVGAVVVPQRHRFVDGDPNWDEPMGRFLGQVARVTRLSGVDEAGCPGVRLDVDGGRWFWRVRDLNVGAEPPRDPPAGRVRSELPEACDRTEGTASYGPLRNGSAVVLGRHRPVRGDDNWSPEMSAFVGHVARVVELAGVDEMGCPGVHVDADGRQWFWRIRDLQLTEGDRAIAYLPGLARDHGRPPGEPVSDATADARIPQQCGMSDTTVDYGPLRIGTAVELRRHRPVDGETNWVGEMDPFVGRTARVAELVGVDEQGCALVHVDIDEGDWYWRARDLRLREP